MTLFRSLAVASLMALGSAIGAAGTAGAAPAMAAGATNLTAPSQLHTVQSPFIEYGGGPRERHVERRGPRGNWEDRGGRGGWHERGPRRGWHRPPPPRWHHRPPPYYGPGPGIYFEFGNAPRYYRPAPRYRQVVPARRLSAAHVRWCERRYRSYRAWDNSFQPYNGPRQQCWSPYS